MTWYKIIIIRKRPKSPWLKNWQTHLMVAFTTHQRHHDPLTRSWRGPWPRAFQLHWNSGPNGPSSVPQIILPFVSLWLVARNPLPSWWPFLTMQVMTRQPHHESSRPLWEGLLQGMSRGLTTVRIHRLWPPSQSV